MNRQWMHYTYASARRLIRGNPSFIGTPTLTLDDEYGKLIVRPELINFPFG